MLSVWRRLCTHLHCTSSLSSSNKQIRLANMIFTRIVSTSVRIAVVVYCKEINQDELLIIWVPAGVVPWGSGRGWRRRRGRRRRRRRALGRRRPCRSRGGRGGRRRTTRWARSPTWLSTPPLRRRRSTPPAGSP